GYLERVAARLGKGRGRVLGSVAAVGRERHRGRRGPRGFPGVGQAALAGMVGTQHRERGGCSRRGRRSTGSGVDGRRLVAVLRAAVDDIIRRAGRDVSRGAEEAEVHALAGSNGAVVASVADLAVATALVDELGIPDLRDGRSEVKL